MRVVEAGGGGLQDLKVADRPDPPAPGPGQASVEMLAMSINPADLLLMEGRYGVRPEPPFTPGAEGVARVTAVGEGVPDLSVGDVVIPLAGPAWVERMTVPAAGLIRLPADVDLDQAAMLKANPATALAMLKDIVALEPGDWVAQNAGNSAVGVNVIRIAKALGLRTLSVVRRESSVARLKALGADAVAVHDGAGPLEAPQAPKLAFDAVGGAATNALASIMAEGGTIANYGLLSGKPCEVDPHHLVFRDVRLRGFWLTSWFRQQPKGKVAETYAWLSERLAKGEIGAPVIARYPIDQAAEAVAHAAREAREGKVLLITQAHPAA